MDGVIFFEVGQQLLHLADTIENEIVARNSRADSCSGHPCLYGRVGEHVKEPLKDATVLLSCSQRVDGRYALFPDTSFVELVTGFHSIGYIHEGYSIVLLSAKGIVDFLAEPLRYTVVNTSLDDIITEIWMRKGNNHFYNRFLIELFLPFGSFSFYPLPFLFFLFKPGVVVFAIG